MTKNPNGDASSSRATPKKTVGRPKSAAENEIRATFIVNAEYLEKMKDIAYWERLLIKDVIEQSFSDYIKEYEKKNGPLAPRVKK